MDHLIDGTPPALAQGRMVRIPGGTFLMGSDQHYPEERPVHPVLVSPFWMDETAITNAQFAAFVAATGYITVAERPLDPALYPGAPPENLVPGSLVFHMTDGPVDTRDISNW
jgi:formylglycine-generating enzyme required for sulfatase activity